MGLKNEKSYCHWAVTLCQQRMIAAEHFCEPDLVVITLTHLTSIHSDHIIVQPVAGRFMFIADSTLCDLAFMMRELQIHTTTMNVELVAEVLCAHCGTFYMPPGETRSPGTVPPHDVVGWSSFP